MGCGSIDLRLTPRTPPPPPRVPNPAGLRLWFNQPARIATLSVSRIGSCLIDTAPRATSCELLRTKTNTTDLPTWQSAQRSVWPAYLAGPAEKILASWRSTSALRYRKIRAHKHGILGACWSLLTRMPTQTQALNPELCILARPRHAPSRRQARFESLPKSQTPTQISSIRKRSPVLLSEGDNPEAIHRFTPLTRPGGP